MHSIHSSVKYNRHLEGVAFVYFAFNGLFEGLWWSCYMNSRTPSVLGFPFRSFSFCFFSLPPLFAFRSRERSGGRIGKREDEIFFKAKTLVTGKDLDPVQKWFKGPLASPSHRREVLLTKHPKL